MKKLVLASLLGAAAMLAQTPSSSAPAKPPVAASKDQKSATQKGSMSNATPATAKTKKHHKKHAKGTTASTSTASKPVAGKSVVSKPAPAKQ